MRNRLQILTGAGLLALALMGCAGDGGSAQQVSSADAAEAGSVDPAEPSPTAVDPSKADQALAESLVENPGDRILVVSDDGQNTTGYVNYETVSQAGTNGPTVSPVYAEGGPSGDTGTIIAYWGQGLGWIPLDVYNSPSFDYEERVAERQATIAAAESGQAATEG